MTSLPAGALPRGFGLGLGLGLGRGLGRVRGILALQNARGLAPGTTWTDLSFVTESLLHRALTKAEEAVLSRTLTGRRLVRDVKDGAGLVVFASGAEIDKDLLDQARERDLLDVVVDAAEPGTSDTELEDLVLWLRERRRAKE
jgi:hypothetical protein